MGQKIKIKRGLKANLPTLDIGEPAICTDTNEFFVGTTAGNIVIGDFSALTQEINQAKGGFSSLQAKLNSMVIEGGGSGLLSFQTLADAQAALPNGTAQPIWIISENSWYYWSGAVTEPPADTTAPVLTITAGGTFTGTKTVTLSAADANVTTIYYTLDGSTPTIASAVYSSPLSITATTTLKAFAKDTVGNTSTIQTVVYTLDTAPADTTPPENVTNLAVSNQSATGMTLTWTAVSDAVSYDIYRGATLLANVTSTTYTANGLTASTQYTFTVKAKDAANNVASGSSVSGTTIAPPDTTAPVLTITPANTFTDTQTVTMTTNETATIYYTLDDTDPKTSGTKLTYTAPLTLTTTDTIKAYARDTAGNESVVQTVTYTKIVIDSTAPTVTASPVAGTFASTQNVTLTADETATIYYTVDGSTPTFPISGTTAIYSAPIPISTTTTLKYFGKDTAGNSSEVQTEVYTISMALVFRDTFTGANGTALASHSPDYGGSWDIMIDTWEIRSGLLQRLTSSTGSRALKKLSTNNYDLIVTSVDDLKYVGATFNYDEVTKKGYHAIVTSATTLVLYSETNVAYTALQTLTIPDASIFTIKVVARNGLIDLYYNEQLILSQYSTTVWGNNVGVIIPTSTVTKKGKVDVIEVRTP